MFWKLVALIIQHHSLISADDKLKEKAPTETYQTPKISSPSEQACFREAPSAGQSAAQQQCIHLMGAFDTILL